MAALHLQIAETGMDKFAEIRPYHDHEVRPVIRQIIADDEFVSMIINYKLSTLPQILKNLLAPVVRAFLRYQVRNVSTVADFQIKVVHYLEYMIKHTVTRFGVSGIDKLDMKQAYLFVGNHRDITLDPALTNYARYLSQGDTVRIAVGDNLLKKEFISHLIRINKSFVVKRSAKAPRKLLESLKLLSDYITTSLFDDGQCIWIAQREGRAKDGRDRTDPAIIKMFAINQGKKGDFPQFMASLKMVPVSISYEYDPCDVMKARELHAIDTLGNYEKTTFEDVTSIATGISGWKGHIHISFGDVYQENFQSPEEIANWLDQQIVKGYLLYPSNYFAYERLFGHYPQGACGEDGKPFNLASLGEEKQFFDQRMDAMPEHLRPYVLQAYANPVISKEELGLLG